MSKFTCDLHIHTIASQHAYSSLRECAVYAASQKIKVIGISDHAPSMLDAPEEYYFMNLRILPKMIEGVRVLKGVELNIMDEAGLIDLRSHILEPLDYAIASYHPGISPSYYDSKKFTQGFLKVMDNSKVRILGHIDNPLVPFEHETVLEKAKQNEVLIEVNNSSYGYVRPGSFELGKEIFSLAKSMGNYLIISSDAHYHEHIGRFDKALQLLREIDFPEDRIVNHNPELLQQFLKLQEL